MPPPAAPDVVSLVVDPPSDRHERRLGIVGAGTRMVLPLRQGLTRVVQMEERRPRWAWWAGEEVARLLVEGGVRPARAWDVGQAHRLFAGGMTSTPAVAWATAQGLPAETIPSPPAGDLFDQLLQEPQTSLIRDDGHLRPDAAVGMWRPTDEELLAWGDVLLQCVAAQHALAARVGPRVVATVHAESAAAVLCEELRHDGLPVDRAALVDLVGPLSGPREERDAAVLRHVRGSRSIDLRNPAQVRELLASVGIEVSSTRKHVLEMYRQAHPVVDALLVWRAQERIATTYGLRWIEQHIGTDDRLRGDWSPCDGAAGRMTAQAGLHNLPVMLRPGVAAPRGNVLVRADLGQIEPRVLAVVSGDRAFAQASEEADLYAPVAARLGVDRPTAKIAVLAAMYGQRSGAAGQALQGLERAYPVAMEYLDRAYAAGVAGQPLRTFGGRLIPTARLLTDDPVGADPRLDAARGRFARNAVVQGAAAELFKAWAATVRAGARPLGARIVLCLHDELLVEAPAEHADAVAELVGSCLAAAARRWSGGAPVRFVADLRVVERWSQAKD